VPCVTDADLLRAFEPILRFNACELFLPTTADAYVGECALWEITPSGEHVQLVPNRELDLDRLVDLGQHYADRTLYLRFVEKPFNRLQYWAWRRDGHYAHMPHTSRFANVGISTRIIDAFFRLTLVLRRRLPKGTVSAGETVSREHMSDAPCTYYGRVVHDAGWTVCQYWFFYAINDWRSSYHGINDHEADWETVHVYLSPDEQGELVPRWVSSSSHDAEGDALRRRVDDPLLEWEGDHLVLYTGAGSHSHSFAATDELIRVDAPRLKTFVNVTRRAVSILTPWIDSSGFQEGLGIPFVDYHRGDGLAIGPGGDREWNQAVISDETPWVSGYRGRWGRDTGDRFGGESGPTGPRYERNGIDRVRWNDPVGWAGLQKVSPRIGVCDDVLQARLVELETELTALDLEIDTRREAARREMVQAQAMEIDTVTRALSKTRYIEARVHEEALLELTDRRRHLAAERASIARAAVEGLPPTGPRDHLRSRPVAETVVKSSRVLRIWAAVSTSVLLAILVWLLVGNDSDHYWFGVGVGIVALAGVESIARKRLPQFIASMVALGIAIALLIAFVHEWRIALAAVLGVVALYLLFENVRELLDR